MEETGGRADDLPPSTYDAVASNKSNGNSTYLGFMIRSVEVCLTWGVLLCSVPSAFWSSASPRSRSLIASGRELEREPDRLPC